MDSVPIVQMLLLCKGVNTNQCNDCGVTSLHVAESRPMVELLLAAGANPNVVATTNGPSLRAKNEKIVHFKAKKSTVYSASERGKADVVDALLSAGASHQANGSEDPLFVACERNFADVVRLLLRHGVDPNRHKKKLKFAEDANIDKSVRNVLCLACDLGHLEIVRLLLDAGAAVNDSDLRRHTPPLHFALKPGIKTGSDGNVFTADRLAIIDLLLERGACVNVASATDGRLHSCQPLPMD